MTDIAIVGLDTSHPEAFAELIADRSDLSLAAVWDGRVTRDDEYVADFCEQHGADEVDEPADAIDAVDAAMVLTVDWDSHAEQAVPFLEAGVPTMIDKPVAGRTADLDAIRRAADHAPLFGGSAVPFYPGLRPESDDAGARQVHAVGYNDPFYYGTHVADSIRRMVGADWHAVAPSGVPGLSVDVIFENDAHATVRLDGPDEDTTFGFLVVSDEVRTVEVGGSSEEMDAMYDAFLDAFHESATGERDDTDLVLDAAELLLAIHASLHDEGAVARGSGALDDLHVAADEFVASYEPYY